MTKLTLAGLALLASAAFADYYISQFTEGTITVYGDYPFVFAYNGVKLGNPPNEYYEEGYTAVNEDVGKIYNATLVLDTLYGAGALGIKNGEGTKGETMADCAAGFSYWYKGDAHTFKIEYTGASGACKTTEDGSNSFKATKNYTATWKQAVFEIGDLETSAWKGSDCETVADLELAAVTQVAWELQAPLSGKKGDKVNLAIDNFVCLDGGDKVEDDTEPDSKISATTGWEDVTPASSSSGGSSGGDTEYWCLIDDACLSYETVKECRDDGGKVQESRAACNAAKPGANSSSSGGTTPAPSSSSVSTSGKKTYCSSQQCKLVAEETCEEENRYGSTRACNDAPDPTPLLTAPEFSVNEAPYKIFDLQGNAVRAGFGVANLSGLAGGVYLVRTGSESRTVVVK
jgi:hypothetical protein